MWHDNVVQPMGINYCIMCLLSSFQDHHSLIQFLHDLVRSNDHLFNLYCSTPLTFTQAKMIDCVIAADGYSHERDAITSWLESSNKSPMTGKDSSNTRLHLNSRLRAIISEHAEL